MSQNWQETWILHEFYLFHTDPFLTRFTYRKLTASRKWCATRRGSTGAGSRDWLQLWEGLLMLATLCCNQSICNFDVTRGRNIGNYVGPELWPPRMPSQLSQAWWAWDKGGEWMLHGTWVTLSVILNSTCRHLSTAAPFQLDTLPDLRSLSRFQSRLRECNPERGFQATAISPMTTCNFCFEKQ